jgi:hypothetical protein
MVLATVVNRGARACCDPARPGLLTPIKAVDEPAGRLRDGALRAGSGVPISA